VAAARGKPARNWKKAPAETASAAPAKAAGGDDAVWKEF